MSTAIYLDESGYTGEDLLNISQPIFVLASSTLDNDLSLEMFNRFFSGLQGNELKHKNLGSRARGQERIIEFIREIKNHDAIFTTFVVHKEFNLLTKLIDLWVEPAMYKNGYDLYDRGGNIAIANVTYIVLNSLLPEGGFRRLLNNFQIMMRYRSIKSYEHFWGPLYNAYYTYHDNSEHPVAFALSLLLGGEIKLGYKHLTNLPPHSLDIAVSCCLVTISHWREKKEDTFNVIHDKSSAMANERWLWDIIVCPDAPCQEVGHDRRTMRFPLNVEKTLLADSRDYCQLQFVDIIAGATSALFISKLRPSKKSNYTEALEESGIEDFLIGGIWPSKDVDPESLGTTGDNLGDAANFIAELIDRSKKTRK